jgi:hypothetical protein
MCAHSCRSKKALNTSQHDDPEAAVNLESNQWLSIKNDDFLNVHLQRSLLE